MDVDPATYNLDPAQVERAITPRTRAIVPVHLYGQPAAMDTLCDIARAHRVAVVADAAQAVGAAYGGRPVAAWGDVSILSFYPTKNLGGCGDGGMVLTTRDDVAERVRLLRDHGAPRRYTHVELGGVQPPRRAAGRAAAGQAQAPAAVERAPARDRGPLLGRARRPAPRAAGRAAPAHHIYHQYTVRSAKREALAAALAARGIGTSIHYPSTIPAQPVFSRPNADREFPAATQAAAEVLLPALLPGADRRARWPGGGGGEAVRRRGDVR